MSKTKDQKEALVMVTEIKCEIEAVITERDRYKAALEKIRNPSQSMGLLWWQEIARKALENKK